MNYFKWMLVVFAMVFLSSAATAEEVSQQQSQELEIRKQAGEVVQAVQSGDLSQLRALVEEGYPLNETDGKGVTPLYAAVRDAHLSIVKYLIKAGARVDTHSVGGPAVHAATKGVKDCMQHGGKLSDAVNVLAFVLAVAEKEPNSRVSQTEMLRAAEVLEAARKRQAEEVVQAVQSGNLSRLRELVEEGYPLNESDGDGVTPLYAAIRDANLPLVDYLLKAGARVDINSVGGTAVHAATEKVKYCVRRNSKLSDAVNVLASIFSAAEKEPNSRVSQTEMLRAAKMLKYVRHEQAVKELKF